MAYPLLTIGLARRSATASTSALAPRAPAPTSITTRSPLLSTSAARWSASVEGTAVQPLHAHGRLQERHGQTNRHHAGHDENDNTKKTGYRPI